MTIKMHEIVNDANYFDIVKKLISTNTKEVSKGSNLQNIPTKGDGVLVRKAFKPRDGWIFLAADLSQIEPRIQAHIMYTRYGDNSMRQIFVDGTDLYTSMAIKVFGLEEKYCVDKAYDPTGKFKPRAMMKMGVLAVSYDQQPQQFAKTMKVSDEIAVMFFDLFNKTFPSFKQMVKDIRDGMKAKGYVETLYGRKRRFPEYKIVAAEVARNERKLMNYYIERSNIRKKTLKTSNDLQRLTTLEELIAPLAEKRNLVSYWERAAFNAVIQGTGADILKKNMVEISKICQARNWELNASIHDEVKISIPIEELSLEACQILTDAMTKSVELSLPLKSDTVIERLWMDEYDPSEWDFEKQQPKEAA